MSPLRLRARSLQSTGGGRDVGGRISKKTECKSPGIHTYYQSMNGLGMAIVTDRPSQQCMADWLAFLLAVTTHSSTIRVLPAHFQRPESLVAQPPRLPANLSP